MPESKALKEFQSVVDMLYGVYIDAALGFDLLKQHTLQLQYDMIEQFKDDPKIANMEYMDERVVAYTDSDVPPGNPTYRELHRTTQGLMKERNTRPSGNNFKFIGNLFIISVYTYWEEYYRAEYAKEIGVKKEDIKSPIFGDIRLLRNSIVHHRGIALKEIEKSQILKWYGEGDTIFISSFGVDKIAYELNQYIIKELES